MGIESTLFSCDAASQGYLRHLTELHGTDETHLFLDTIAKCSLLDTRLSNAAGLGPTVRIVLIRSTIVRTKLWSIPFLKNG